MLMLSSFWPTTPSLRVLSYNVFTGPPTPTALAAQLEGSKRLTMQVDRIKELAPDIVCLQEVQSDGLHCRWFESKLADEYSASYVLTTDEVCSLLANHCLLRTSGG